MPAPAVTVIQSPLESALSDVQATLAELLLAADEQHAAVVARDRDRIESVTRQQERLSARLARAEALRLRLLAENSLTEVIAHLPEPEAARVKVLRDHIATSVRELKQRHSRTARLLERTIELGQETLNFLQRLVAAPNPAYSARGYSAPRLSVLVDSRA